MTPFNLLIYLINTIDPKSFLLQFTNTHHRSKWRSNSGDKRKSPLLGDLKWSKPLTIIFRHSEDHGKTCLEKKCSQLSLWSICTSSFNDNALHSFRNTLGERTHLPILQKFYCHSNLKTTFNYQANLIHKDADDTLINVLNFYTHINWDLSILKTSSPKFS